MVQIDSPKVAEGEGGRYTLTPGTLAAVVLAVCLAQMALAVPSLIIGLIQQDLAPSSAQLTWVADAFFLPVAALELGFGVFGDLFGRKRLLVGGAALIAVGSTLAVLVPGSGYSTDTRVSLLILAQLLSGIGAAAIFPTSLAMVAASTRTPPPPARGAWRSGPSRCRSAVSSDRCWRVSPPRFTAAGPETPTGAGPTSVSWSSPW